MRIRIIIMHSVSWLCICLAIFGIITVIRGGDNPPQGYGSKLAVKCPTNNLIGAVNNGKDIFGLCVKPFVCGQHLLSCVPTPCGNGESPFTFVNTAKETGPSQGRKRRDAIANNIKTTCCKTEESINGQQLYEFTQFYTVFDDNTTPGKVLADAYNVRAVSNVPYGGEYVKSIKPVTGGYVVGTGYIQCDQTTTERPSTPPTDLVNNNVASPGGTGPACFAGDQQVVTQGGIVRMDQLKVGDKVWTKSDTFGAHSFEPVKFFIHREPEQSTTFISIKTGTNRAVRMTPNHLIPVVPCDFTNPNPGSDGIIHLYKPASEVEVGQCVIDQDGVTPVIDISQSEDTGIYSPITDSGTIMVNGVLCSVHVDSGALSFQLHVTLFRLIHAVQNLLGLDWVSANQFQELPHFVDVLLNSRAIA